GILFVAAAGNETINNDVFPCYPSSYDLDNIISVMATDRNDEIAYYSNYGPHSVDIAAPGGVQYFEGDPRGILSTIAGGGYAYIQGTSMAAAHVAGAAALVWSTDPNLTHIEVKEKLVHPLAIDRIPALQGHCVSGGRLNAYEALTLPDNGGLVVNTSIPYNSNDPSTYWETIQAAIDANDTNDGDVLIAAAGIYIENIDFSGKRITLRSGNIYDYNDANINPESTIIDGNSNGLVVSFQGGEGLNTVLKGFTIIGGLANYGGGIGCYGASPTITDCIITVNTAMYYGGGIECDGGSPTITNCNITNNNAVYYGGGIDCFYASPTITNCIITNNRTSDYRGIGGGVNCEQASPTIAHCTITNNDANSKGGGVACYYSDPNIFNCFITNNSATYLGGGIDCELSSPTITNCTVVGNTAAEGGGILADQNSLPTITNCILWGSGDDLYGCSAKYSCIQDGDPGTGNVHSDPLFVTGPRGDYYLSQIAAGQLADSPCVDAG
ncbi:unnamed protein product, partial [marine sediment metagenome]